VLSDAQEAMGARMVARLRSVYRRDPGARRFFDWAAGRTNDAAQTTIERMAQKAELERRDAVQFARELEDIGCGQFIVGRRGARSRIAWRHSLISIGETAAGRAEALKLLDADLQEEATEAGQDSASSTVEGRDSLSVRLSREAQAVLSEAATTHDAEGASMLAQEILESWAERRLEERRGATIGRAVAYLRSNAEWADDPADFFPAAKD
jgi:hypothetical protein